MTVARLCSSAYNLVSTLLPSQAEAHKTTTWTKDPGPCRKAVQAELSFPRGVTEIVVHYLERPSCEKLGPEEQETLYGKKEVEKLCADRGGALTPKIDMMASYPLDKIQTLGTAMFLIFVPQKVTLNVVRSLGKQRGFEIRDDAFSQRVFREIGDREGDRDAWCLVANKTMPESNWAYDYEITAELRAAGLVWVSLRVYLYALFSKCAWQEKTLKEGASAEYVSCEDTLDDGGVRLAVGIQKDGKLAIKSDLACEAHSLVMKVLV